MFLGLELFFWILFCLNGSIQTAGSFWKHRDRCGQGGGCSGKPPLLAWAVWEVYQKTQDLEFLREMYAVARDFHHFWYEHRDVTGTGLCSWTEGMESGMDDGVRFQSEFAKSVSNASTHVA